MLSQYTIAETLWTEQLVYVTYHNITSRFYKFDSMLNFQLSAENPN